MDRVTTYVGAVPSAKDVLKLGQFAMTGLGKIADGVFGTGTIVNGFTCEPTSPASLAVVLGPGEVYELESLEATAVSALPSDTAHQIVKQGVLLDSAQLGITPPATSGYSQVFLIQVQYADSDTSTQVLNYYNSADPGTPFWGPPVNGVGSGQAQSTVRAGTVAYQVKAGAPAITGTQVAPTADAGWTGLFTITVANGATSISSGNITKLSTAPFIKVKLPDVPAWVQRGEYAFANDAGSANVVAITLDPVPASLGDGGFHIFVKKVNAANTGAMTGTIGLADGNTAGPYNIVDQNGAAIPAGNVPAGMLMHLCFDGSVLRLVNGAVEITNVSSITALSGEGILVKPDNSVNLNYPGLDADSTPADTDIVSRYSTGDSKHVQMTWAQHLASLGIGQTQSHSLSTPGTSNITVPSWARRMRWRAWGGGGAGGNGQNGGAAGGGGGGEYREGVIWVKSGGVVQPGDTITAIVGAGGAVNTANGGNGGNGGSSSLSCSSSGTIAVAVGGSGGLGTGIPIVYQVGGNGGSGGAGGYLSIPGSKGGSGAPWQAGVGGSAFGAPVAATQFISSQQAGVAGVKPGGAGSGSGATYGFYPLGGAGAAGRIDIWFEG